MPKSKYLNQEDIAHLLELFGSQKSFSILFADDDLIRMYRYIKTLRDSAALGLEDEHEFFVSRSEQAFIEECNECLDRLLAIATEIGDDYMNQCNLVADDMYAIEEFTHMLAEKFEGEEAFFKFNLAENQLMEAVGQIDYAIEVEKKGDKDQEFITVAGELREMLMARQREKGQQKISDRFEKAKNVALALLVDRAEVSGMVER